MAAFSSRRSLSILVFVITLKLVLPQVGDTNITQPKDAAG
jgi:hypothetical protein